MLVVFKTVFGWIISLGVGKVLSGAIQQHTPRHVGRIARFLTWVGAWAIGLFVGEKVTEYAKVKLNTQIDEVDGVIKTVKGVLADENKKA